MSIFKKEVVVPTEKNVEYYKIAIEKLWYSHHYKKYKSRYYHEVKVTFASNYIASGKGLTELEAFQDAYKNVLKYRHEKDPNRNDDNRKYSEDGKISHYWQEELPL